MTTVRSLSAVTGTPHGNAFPEAEPKTIRLELDAGESVAPHTHPDREIVFYVVDGTVALQIGNQEHEVTAGDIARFDGAQEIAPRAIEATTALIVLANRSDD